MPAIGIDFGTANCRVAVLLNGKITVFENEFGEKETPSYVAFTKDKRLIGKEAAQHAVKDPRNTIFGIKKIIGRDYRDQILSSFKDEMDFTIKGKENVAVIQATKYSEREFYPEEIVAILLNQMKEIAELHLREAVTGAVITVPASFSDTQRRAIERSANIAKIHVLELINETTAVAVAYATIIGNDEATTHDHRTMIFQLGAGTTSAAVVRIKAHIVDVQSSVAISNLGGDKFDEQLMTYWTKKQEKHFKEGIDIHTKTNLRNACRAAKKKLSLLPNDTITVESSTGVYQEEITRETFQEINNRLYSIALDVVHIALKIANTGQIDDVVVVGGQTRVLNAEFWDKLGPLKEKRNKRLNEDEGAVIGAAIRAEHLSGDHFKESRIAVNDAVSERRYLGINKTQYPMQTGKQMAQFDDEDVRRVDQFCCKYYCDLTISSSNGQTRGMKSDEVNERAKRMKDDRQRDLERQKLENAVNVLCAYANTWKNKLHPLERKCNDTLTWISDEENKTLDEVLRRYKDLKDDTTKMFSQDLENPRAIPSQENFKSKIYPNAASSQDSYGQKSTMSMQRDHHNQTARNDYGAEKGSQMNPSQQGRGRGAARGTITQVSNRRGARGGSNQRQ